MRNVTFQTTDDGELFQHVIAGVGECAAWNFAEGAAAAAVVRRRTEFELMPSRIRKRLHPKIHHQQQKNIHRSEIKSRPYPLYAHEPSIHLLSTLRIAKFVQKGTWTQQMKS